MPVAWRAWKPLLIAAPADIHPGGTEDTDGVETGVLKEALILSREDGVAEDHRNVFVADYSLLLAGSVEEVGQKLWFQFVDGSGAVVLQRDNLLNPVAGELDGGRLLVKIGVVARKDLNGVGTQCVVADQVVAVFVVSGVAQGCGDLTGVVWSPTATAVGAA